MEKSRRWAATIPAPPFVTPGTCFRINELYRRHFAAVKPTTEDRAQSNSPSAARTASDPIERFPARPRRIRPLRSERYAFPQYAFLLVAEKDRSNQRNSLTISPLSIRLSRLDFTS